MLPGGGDGTASYTFALADNGDAVLSFLHPTVGSVNINAISGSLLEDDLFVPNITFTTCVTDPTLFGATCTDTTNTLATITVPPTGTNSNRLAIVSVHRTGDLGTPGPTASSTTFNGVAMTLLRDSFIPNAGALDLQSQIYGMLDANLPGTAGPWTVTATNNGTTRICVLIYQNMDQTALSIPPPIMNSLVQDNLDTSITTTLGAVVQSFTASNAGYTTPASVTSLDVLLVAGGGGGGGDAFGAGGGGAGGVVWRLGQAVTASTNYPIVVGGDGTAGAAAAGFGGTGGNTTMLGLTALGGGGGQPGNRTTTGAGVAGGSGGGGGSNDTDATLVESGGAANQPGSASGGFGFAGAAGTSNTTNNENRGGGGGGSGALGTVGVGGATGSGGAGGTGLDFSRGVYNWGTSFGVAGFLAGGGGGGKRTGGAGGAGGAGGGGAGSITGVGTAATANTGGGGGGSGSASQAAGGAGGSGLVLVRYIDPTTLTGNALLISAASARLNVAGTRSWTPLDADMSSRVFSSTASSTLVFGVSSGYVASPGSKTITETHNGANSDKRNQVLAAFRPAASALHQFRISHSGSGNTCAPNAVTIKAMNQYGAVLTSYTGTVTLSASGALGDWSGGTGGGLSNGAANDGAATYAFQAGDNGVVTLSYTRTATNPAVDFGVTAGAIVESPYYDGDLAIVACSFRISHAGTGSNCAPNTVTIGLYTPGGVLATNYTGTVTLTASGGLGDWGDTDGLNNVVQGTANDGIATYTFASGDLAEVNFTFSRNTTGTVNFNTTDSVHGVNASFDADMVIQSCYFRISHDGSGDVCSLEAVTITVVNSGGVTQTGYTGTVNISTSTSVGTWSKSGSQTGFTPIGVGVGTASYAFQSGDNGVVVLNLMHHTTGATVSINLNSGSFQEEVGFDPALNVAACTMRFSLSSPNATACTTTTVTLGVYNSGGTLAPNYVGDVTLTTSTIRGTWVSDNGPGTIVDTAPPGNGTGTYTFATGDGGDAQIVFTSTDVESINFNATANSGSITVSVVPAHDPNLNVTACLPIIAGSACYANASQVDAITLPSSADALASRMVLMYVGSSSGTNATGATLEGVAMTLLRTEFANFGGGTKLHVYGILDVNLPAAAGAYDAAFTGSANSPAMCIVALKSVAQAFPLTNMTPTSGQLNGTNVQNADPISTGITTNANNSLVLGVAINSQGGSTYLSSLTNTLWQGGAADPAGADWAGHSSFQLAAGAVTVIDDADVIPNRQAQIALALAPFVAGAPAAVGYVPVTLFKSYSGNVNYRAIGNTLRAFQNAVVPPFTGDCVMVPDATGSAATMTLPAGSTVMEAYLYWAGSGFVGDVDQTVTFGIDAPPAPNAITSANQVFIIAPNQVYNPDYAPVAEGFFAAYKDVTGFVSANASTTYRFSGLTVRTDSVWAQLSTCVSGWSLVVVYENPAESLNVINLFHGFQPFFHSAFTLVPRNFRMATPDGDMMPHAQVTHVTFEGDSDIASVDEVIQLQNNPAVQTFTTLVNPPPSPATNQFNSTTSFPNYDINLKFLGTYSSVATSYGTDVDTFYVEGDTSGELIYPFGALEAEQITSRYSTGQDIVLLVGEFISVTNAPIADLEVFVTDTGTWKVDTTGAAKYGYSVKNNGNGAVTGGFADGDVILAGNMPPGITINAITAPGWNCSLATTTAFTCRFDITTSWTIGLGAATAGKLAKNEFLPTVEVTVNIGNETSFPLLDNTITTVARMAHVGSYASCTPEAAGVQPNPNPAGGCSKPPQFDNKNDLNKYLIDVDNLNVKTATNNNVHHNTRNVRGVETNLSMNKSVSGILEVNTAAVYLLNVTNNGPDATTKTITVTDTLPAGLVPVTAVGTNWSCNIAVQLVTCTRTLGLNVGAAPVITITTAALVSPAVESYFVSNTATVAAGTYNFDTVPANNSDTNITAVTGPVASSTERFLLSVSEDGSTLGGLTFDEGDLVIYDPVSNIATMFMDESSLPGVTNLGDVDAVHLLPNGHIILSTDVDGSTINGVTFNAEDLVLYDPQLQTATLIFDGSAAGYFSSDTVDLDAVQVVYNNSYTPADWDIVLSTTGNATLGTNALSLQDNDIVSYDITSGVATLLADGADDDLFNGATGDISALYIRVADADKYILSTSDASATIGLSGQTAAFQRGELVEIDLSIANAPTTVRLFCDGTAPCIGSPPAIFTPASATRRLDSVHVIETSYFGHFAVTSLGGNVCSATAITIRKHAGLTHTVETFYRGSIVVSNNLGTGVWAKDVTANGTITNLGGGSARYTFAPGDNGQVILYITGTVATNTFNVNITNGIGVENNPTEDPNIIISNLATVITYGDQFGAVTYNFNDGVAAFATAWAETDDDGTAAAGDIRITDGQLRLNNNGGGGQPSLMRQIDFTAYSVDSPPVLSFNWSISGSPTGNIVIEARGTSVGNPAWTTLQTFSASSGSGSVNYGFTGAPWNLVLSATTQIRFRIASGYSANASEFFFIDNVQVSTQTNQCGVGGSAIDHYAMTHSGSMVSCLAQNVTITPHDVSHSVVKPGAGIIITLNTSTSKGFWGPPTNGGGPFTAGTDNGQATYRYLLGEDSLTFPFYYTELASNPQAVTLSLVDTSVPNKSNNGGETTALSVALTGLRFFNDTDSNGTFPTLVAGMPSNTYPAKVLIVQAIQASSNNPNVCRDVFPNNADHLVELAFECIDSGTCAASAVPVQVTNNGNTVSVEPVDTNSGNGANPGGYVSMLLRFTTFTGGDFGSGRYSGAALVLNYGDAGQIQIHGRHNIVVQNQLGAPLNSGDYMVGSGANNFIVRPFAFDIDFSLNRNANGNDNDATSWAADANGNAFFAAGAGFDTTVRAVAWQSVDDDSSTGGETANDGVPDSGADLYNNTTTPNFGNELAAAMDDVTITRTPSVVMPMGSVAGTLSTPTFTDFGAGGSQTHTLAYSEVGIIHLAATLDSPTGYLGSTQGVAGNVRNVGRFIPANFQLTVPMLTARPLFTPSAASFTYLGEEFTAAFNLTARNALGATTLNYFGAFAKLTTPAQLSFYAIDDTPGDDISYTTRLSKVAAGPNPFPANYGASWAAGVIALDGNLIFSRLLPSEAVEAPFPDLQIAITVLDADSVIDASRNVDDDDGITQPGTALYRLIGQHAFRYGRLRLENGYGSEIADLNDMAVPIGQDVAVRLSAEYWDGSNFLPNPLDVATTYSSNQLSFVAGTYVDNLGAGEASITAGVSGIISQGNTMETSATDIPLYLRAPGAGNEGGAIIELNLDALAPALSFLKYDWRTAGESEDIKQDADVTTTTDNPRSYVEFGAFRGNDRIINWQEIFE